MERNNVTCPVATRNNNSPGTPSARPKGIFGKTAKVSRKHETWLTAMRSCTSGFTCSTTMTSVCTRRAPTRSRWNSQGRLTLVTGLNVTLQKVQISVRWPKTFFSPFPFSMFLIYMRGVLAEFSPGSLVDPVQPGDPPGVVNGRGTTRRTRR